DDMVEIVERAPGRKHDPSAESLGDPAGALAHPVHHVGLLELRLGGVENQRLPPRQGVMEHGAQTRVPALGHARGNRRCVALRGVEIDVEVRGPQHLKVETWYWTLLRPKYWACAPGTTTKGR